MIGRGGRDTDITGKYLVRHKPTKTTPPKNKKNRPHKTKHQKKKKKKKREQGNSPRELIPQSGPLISVLQTYSCGRKAIEER